MENDAVNMTLRQCCNDTSLPSPSPLSSSSQSGYAMKSYPGHVVDMERPSTKINTSGASARNPTARKDGRRRAWSLPSTTSSRYPLSLPDIDEQATTQRWSFSHLQEPRELDHSSTPEPITPGTRRFHDNMLSLLSLLPLERYQSPSPSIEEHQFEDEADMREPASGVYDASAGSPVHAATIPGSSGTRSSSSSFCSLSGFLEALSEFKVGTGVERA
ncbi:hypothetical protein F5Y12DRAFT_747973, partial [Xylaria sp. FL1777]